MVKLPDQFSLGEPTSLYVRTPVPSASDVNAGAIGRGMEALARGVGEAGSAISNYADQQQKQQDAMDLIKADVAHQKGVADLQSQFDNDTDYATQQQRFQQQADALAANAAQNIQNPDAREKWLLRSQLHNQSAALSVGRQAKAMVQQQKGVDLENQLDQARDIYNDPASDDAKREATMLNMGHYIDMAQDSRLVSPKQADALRKQYLYGSVKDEMDRRVRTDPAGALQFLQGGQQGAQPQSDATQQPAQPQTVEVPTDATATKDVTGRLVTQPAPSQAQPQDIGNSVKALRAAVPKELEDSVSLLRTGDSYGMALGNDDAKKWLQANAGKFGLQVSMDGDNATFAPASAQPQQQAGGIDRSRFAAELQANPALRNKIMAISAGENLDPQANLAVIELMMNRADMMGTSLAAESRLHGKEPNGYYAGYSPRALQNPQTRAMIEQNLQTALQGSNVSNYATDNASGSFAADRNSNGMYAKTFSAGGETFSYPTGDDARGHDRYQDWKDRVSTAQAGTGTATDAGTGSTPKLPGRFGVLSPLERQQYIEQAKQQLQSANSAQAAELSQRVDDDTARLRASGVAPVYQDGKTSLDRAREMLKPKDFEKKQFAWNMAQREHDVLGPLHDMSEEEAQAHLEKFAPKSEDTTENYKAASAVQAKAEKKLDAIMNSRRTDPAYAVDPSNPDDPKSWPKAREVQAARDAIRNPQTQQLSGEMGPAQPLTQQQKNAAIVQARLAAQSRLGIPEGMQAPITRDEAQGVLGISGDIKNLSPTELNSKVKAAAARAEQMYGPDLAPRVMDSAISYMIKNQTQRMQEGIVARKALTGAPVTSNDVYQLNLARQLEPLATVVSRLNPRPDTSLALPAAAATIPGQPQPNKQQIELLQQNPDQWEAFDRKFGPGAAARHLVPAPQKGQAAPPPPSLWQRIGNAFQSAPPPAPTASPGYATTDATALTQPRNYNPALRTMDASQ